MNKARIIFEDREIEVEFGREHHGVFIPHGSVDTVLVEILRADAVKEPAKLLARFVREVPRG